MINQKLF